MAIHEVQFHKNRQSGVFRAMCTCGWTDFFSSLDQAQSRAAGHEIDQWECVPADQQQSVPA